MRGILENFLALFRFTEADVRALLSGSGYAFYMPEPDCLQDNRPCEQKETRGKLRQVSYPNQGISWPPGLTSIGVHPDFIRGNWTTASRKRAHR
jgi:hypothetical protein